MTCCNDLYNFQEVAFIAKTVRIIEMVYNFFSHEQKYCEDSMYGLSWCCIFEKLYDHVETLIVKNGVVPSSYAYNALDKMSTIWTQDFMFPYCFVWMLDVALHSVVKWLWTLSKVWKPAHILLM